MDDEYSCDVPLKDGWVKKILESSPGRSPSRGVVDRVTNDGIGAFGRSEERVLWFRDLKRARSRFRMENSSFSLML
jgi:hypothetical protein